MSVNTSTMPEPLAQASGLLACGARLGCRRWADGSATPGWSG